MIAPMLRIQAGARAWSCIVRAVLHETPPQRKERVLESVAALARRERWVLTTAELRSAGASEAWISRRAEDGWLTRQFRGVWLVGRDRATRDELERAALKACGDGAVLSHRSAAVRWGIVLGIAARSR